jgi:hypothetical protein
LTHSADAIDGKVITGADIRTGASGQRTETVAAGPVYYLDGNQKAHYPPGVVWYTGDPSEVTAGELAQYWRRRSTGRRPRCGSAPPTSGTARAR